MCTALQSIISIMWFNRLLLQFVIPSVFVLSDCTKIQKSWKSNDFSVGERIVKTILESCYGSDSLSDPILIIGDFNESIDKPSVLRMKNFENIREHELQDFQPRKFVLMSASDKELISDLVSLKQTRWWDHMALFFIIEKNGRSCKNFENTKIIIWEMDILNSIYICTNSMNTPTLYTSNPIANYAPKPWKEMEELHNSRIFHQSFDSHVSCLNLNYDKTKYLNGFRIIFTPIIHPDARSSLPDDIYKKLALNDSPKSKIMRVLTEALNANYWFGIRDNNSITDHLSHGFSDLSYDFFPIDQFPGIKVLFPYHSDEIVAVVKLSPEQSTLYKILHLWSTQVLILAFIALAIFSSILALKTHDISSAILDLTRLLIYSSVLIKIKNHSFRIYFATILMLMIISNGTFQGKIASFLTKQERYRPMRTISQLVELGYKFYCIDGSAESIGLRCPECDVTPLSGEICMTYVLNSDANVCLTEKFAYQSHASFPLELVEEPLGPVVLSHKCRQNWALYDRVNDMWMRIIESGLFGQWLREETHRSMEKRRTDDIERSSPKYRPIRLYKLDFAFELLGIGLSLAAIVFIAEMLTKFSAAVSCLKWQNKN